MPSRPTVVVEYCCVRCGHRWIARGLGKPRCCPNRSCKTTAWNGPGRRGRPPGGQDLAREIDTLAEAADSVDCLMSLIVGRLQKRLSHFNWVGFYMIEKGLPGEEPMLVLGPYVGAETPHKRIPPNQGICGAAVTHGHTIVVDDVNSDSRYLACSIETKSEIVAPIFVNGSVVGELDIDSHLPAAFSPDDRRLVEHCASLVGRYLEKTA